MCEWSPSFVQLLLQVNRNKIFLNYWVSLSRKNWSFTIFLLASTVRLNRVFFVSVRSIFPRTHANFGRNCHAVSSVPLMQYSLKLWRRGEYEKYFKSCALYTFVVWDLKAESATTHFPGSNSACQKNYRLLFHVHCKKRINSPEWKLPLTSGVISYFKHLDSNARI